MKKFLKYIIGFSFFTIVILFAIQALISLRIKGKTINGYDNLEQTFNVNADLVLMGSSRAFVHLDPHFFDTTFGVKSVNIAMDGHTEMSSTIIRLKNYLSENKPPRFAIVSFDPFTNAGSETKNTNLVHKNNFARYAFFPSAQNREMVEYFGFDLFEKYVPLYAMFKYKIFKDALYLNKTSAWEKAGYDEHDQKWDTILNPVTDTLKHSFFKRENEASVTASLKELQGFCTKNNIKLLCIQTPVYKILKDDAAFERPAIICRELSIPFVDVNVESIGNDMNNFYNSNHLNRTGVLKLNEVLRMDSTLNKFLSQK